MRKVEEFREGQLIKGLVARIKRELGGKKFSFMEVCGTHTTAMFRHGLRHLLEDSIELLSGPGCPVCVTPSGYLDRAIEIAKKHKVTIATFGDMMRVPGTSSSLERERALGSDVRVVYSPLDAVCLAEKQEGKDVVFLGVGFETTAPLIASSIMEAKKRNISNFYVLSAHKRIPPALEVLACDSEIDLDGFICPGHVSVIIGSKAYESIPRKHGIPCVVTGFEPLDMVAGIYGLARQCLEGIAKVEIAYSRAVTPEGNPRALLLLEEVFEIADAEWRGIGTIPDSGYEIVERFSDLDAAKMFPVEIDLPGENPACLCGEVLKGKVKPPSCSLFAAACTPESPIGPCMVSSEGTCAAYYKYGRTA